MLYVERKITVANNLHLWYYSLRRFTGNVTVGMLAGIVGVTLIGGLSNVSIAVTGTFVQNGILIFYGGFARYFL